MNQISIYTLQLEDLYVKSEHRNKGIGKALFKELAIIAQEKVTALTPLFEHAN
jgi:GNAT superfamily N-acetyltransferase